MRVKTKSMKKFLLLIFGTLLLTAMIIKTIHFWGLGQTYRAFENDFFKGETPYKFVPWEQAAFLQKDANLILWIDVFRADDQTLIARPWVDRQKKIKELEKVANQTRPPILSLLKQFPKSRFVLNVVENAENIHQQLIAVIDSEKADKRVLIQSDFPAVLTSIREEKPMLVFGSSARDLVKMKMMESMWILSAAPFKGDALILPLKAKRYETISAELALEMKRRQKKVILGPLENKQQIEAALQFGADGLFVSDPLLLF